MTAKVAYVLSDNEIMLDGLALSDGTYQNDATVTVTLYDSAGVEVTGESWPLSMAYVSASDGDYKATLADTLGVTENKKYRAVVTAVASSGLKRTFYATLNYIKG